MRSFDPILDRAATEEKEQFNPVQESSKTSEDSDQRKPAIHIQKAQCQRC